MVHIHGVAICSTGPRKEPTIAMIPIWEDVVHSFLIHASQATNSAYFIHNLCTVGEEELVIL